MIDLTKMTEKERKEYEFKQAKEKVISGFKALLFLTFVTLVDYLIVFVFLNPIGFWQRVAGLILFIVGWFVLFKICDFIISS